MPQLALDPALPEVGGDRRDREAFLGEPDRRRQDPGHRQPAVPLDQVAPPRARARDRDRVRVDGWQFVAEAFLESGRSMVSAAGARPEPLSAVTRPVAAS